MFSHNEILAKKRGYRVDRYGYAYDKNNREVGRKNNRGYRYFAFKDENNKVIKVYIHRMQAYQMYGKRIYQDGIQVRHLDGNSLNNSRKNIAIGTALDNHYDKPYKKRVEARERFFNAARAFHIKYNDRTLEKIKKRREEGAKYKDIMKEFGISSKGTLSYIINNRINIAAGCKGSISL